MNKLLAALVATVFTAGVYAADAAKPADKKAAEAAKPAASAASTPAKKK
jgi:hypothetical protein